MKGSDVATGLPTSRQITYRDLEPRYEWKSEGANLRLTLHIPDFHKQDLKVVLDDSKRKLIVEGERRQGNATFLRFSCCFDLPSNSDVEKISGKLGFGLLDINIPLKPENQAPDKPKNDPLAPVSAEADKPKGEDGTKLLGKAQSEKLKEEPLPTTEKQQRPEVGDAEVIKGNGRGIKKLVEEKAIKHELKEAAGEKPKISAGTPSMEGHDAPKEEEFAAEKLELSARTPSMDVSGNPKDEAEERSRREDDQEVGANVGSLKEKNNKKEMAVGGGSWDDEAWRDGEMAVEMEGGRGSEGGFAIAGRALMERVAEEINNNKAVIIAAAVGFSLGLLLSRKLRT